MPTDVPTDLLPERSVLLALWLTATRGRDLAAGAGSVALADLVEHVEGDDEPHRVLAASADTPVGLAWLAARLDQGAEVAAVLPAPGDPHGAPAAVAAEAVAAGECLLLHTDGPWAAVPQVEEFGPPDDLGHLVTWRLHPLDRDWRPLLPGVLGTLAEAEQALRAATTQATAALVALDVARWRPDVARALADLRRGPELPLPPGLDPRVVRVLTDASRLRAVVALAGQDDGAAVSAHQADRRTTALRDVERSARRAVAAATLAAGRLPSRHQPSTDR